LYTNFTLKFTFIFNNAENFRFGIVCGKFPQNLNSKSEIIYRNVENNFLVVEKIAEIFRKIKV
jgi:hypothetical protein